MNITFNKIKAENINYTIKGKPLLDQISVSFNSGEISTIIGPNGSGKSTFIKLLSGQTPPTKGTISLSDNPISQISKKQLAKIQAVLSQSIDMAFPLTVEEVVMMGRYPHFQNQATSKDKEICQEALAYFKIDHMAKRNYLTLSGGEKQRVHFARVTAQIWPDAHRDTKILLLDEPLAYLDIFYQYEFMKILTQFMAQQNMIIIAVIHDLNLAYKFSDKVVLLLNGKLLSHGSTKEVFTENNIQKAFMMSPSFVTHKNGEKILYF